MRILFDHCVTRHFARDLAFASVRTTRQMGWERLTNGELVRAAEEAGFDVLLTVDKSMESQTPLRDSRLAVLVLDARFSDVEHLRPFASAIERAMDELISGSYLTLTQPE